MLFRSKMLLILSVAIVSLGGSVSLSCEPAFDFRSVLSGQLGFDRQATLKLLDEIEKTGHAREALSWRAAPGRAPLGWQIMHIAASEDRFAAKMIGNRPLVSEALAEEFKSGKPAGDRVPELSEIRSYLERTRASLDQAIAGFDLSRLDGKPAPDAKMTFRTIFQVLIWHEGHHEGEARATFNLFKAAHHLDGSSTEK